MSSVKSFARLPTTVVPFHYALKLQPNLKTFRFTGSVEISVEIKKQTSTIKLNSAQLDVDRAILVGESVSATAEVTYLSEDEEIVLRFFEDLEPGKAKLYMQFTGILSDEMIGFYLSKYTVDGKDRYAAVTQFEATEARKAFPCWDEPAIKATFDVTLIVPKDRVALSNMPIVSDVEMEGNLREVTFDTTPIMSTYLLAFVVGEFDYVETTDEDTVQIRVYTPPGKKEHGKYALDMAAKTLSFYKECFGIPYPLPKVDLVAISDCGIFAMENWGLLTFEEMLILIDPENSSGAGKGRVAQLVGHEIAHQWFGNLVTMEWWTHLWLNEGFATWIQNLAVDYCFPEYDTWTLFLHKDVYLSMELDALNNSHPIEIEVGHPTEINSIFDDISYHKGASVIRMLHNFIGEEDFKKGLNMYLTKHQYKNTFTEDLWAALEEASGKSVSAMMSTWTKQMGFPLLHVTQTQEGTERKLCVTQTKFTASGTAPSGHYQWVVPMTVCTEAAPDTAVSLGLLDKDSQEVVVPNVSPNHWVKLNAGTVGYYRIAYSSEMLEALIPAVTSLTLPPKDRLGLQADLFALNRSGQVSASKVLNIVQAYENETNFTVWASLVDKLNLFGVLLQHTESHSKFKAFLCRILSKVAQHVGWDAREGEGYLKPMLRDVVLKCLGKCGHPETVAEAVNRFEKHCHGTAQLPSDLRACVFETVMANGDRKTFDKMLKLLDEADSQEEKHRIALALGCSQELDIIKETLELAISDRIASQESVYVISGTTGSVVGRDLAWQFVKDNFKIIKDRSMGVFLISKLVKNMTEKFTSLEKAEEVENFFKENPVPSAERTVKQSIENIHLNAEWLRREAKPLAEFLQAFS